jgi:hypothetical protein
MKVKTKNIEIYTMNWSLLGTAYFTAYFKEGGGKE